MTPAVALKQSTSGPALDVQRILPSGEDHGTCVGSVANDGGQLTIKGVVTGVVIDDSDATRIAAAGTVHHGRQSV